MMRRLLLCALLLPGCLPEDTRPPPAEVLVTLRAARSTVDGVTTEDGWTVRFERVVLSLGGPDVEGDACDEYADADYFRILDGRLDKPQKVGLLYGLGTCKFEFRARQPQADALLGEGITEDLKFVMREPGKDPYEELAGITYLVRGAAERAGVRKDFFWMYRRRVAYDECTINGSDTFTLTEEARVGVELEVHAEMLVADALDPTKAKLRFDPIANADDGDGVITLEELEAVPLESSGITLGERTEETAEWKTLGNFVYDGLFPRIVRTGAAGACKLRRGPRR